MKEPKKTVYLQLALPLHAQLTELAHTTHRTQPGYIRQIIKHYVRHLEQGITEDDWWYIR